MTLSDKIFKNHVHYIKEESWSSKIDILKTEDVKEFIKDLKEEMGKIDLKTVLGSNRLPSIILREVEIKINTLAGEDLK